MAIDNRTTGRNYPLPHPSNLLAEDVQRLRDALNAIDADVTQLDQLIEDVVDGAPGALDTLNELAAALGDDANFAATVTTALNNRYTKAESDARYVQGVTQTENVFTGTGTQTTFTLSQTPPTRESLLVTVDGVVQPISEYNLSGSALILSEAPASGAKIRVLMLGVAGPVQSASTLSFTQAGTGAVTRTVDSKLKDVVSIKDFGAVGDGVTNDTAAIQAAIDSLPNGGVVYFPPGTYRIARTIGTNDRWGLKITQSNITLRGDQASLRRLNTNISTYALAYPILFVGTPDSNVAAATENFIVEGLNFIGEDTRHSISGNMPPDFRYAIDFKNTRNTLVKDCLFTKVDSQAINYQYPAVYDYANAVFYNTTKNYQAKIVGCTFRAESHSVSGRALIHAISLSGVDGIVVDSNYFEWCDDCVSGFSTYNNYSDKETDTYTESGAASALGPLKRTGRNAVISNNTCKNSSEHTFYVSSMDVSITGNSIYVEDPSICVGDIKVRCRGISVSGNRISNTQLGISITEPSEDVSITGNTINANPSSSYTGGTIDVTSDGITSYIQNRGWLYVGGSPDYQRMENITIAGNTINLPTTAASGATNHIAIRFVTSQSNANYPEGEMRGVSISGNTICNHNVGIYIVNGLMEQVVVSSNTFSAKRFTTSGFNASTTLNTRAVVQASQTGTGVTQTAMDKLTFTNNYVRGSEFLFATNTAAGSATTYFTPRQVTGNRLDYIKNIKTADVRLFDFEQRFSENAGSFFLDRTWPGNSPNNSLWDGTNANSDRRFCFQWTGSALRFYTDDAGTFVTL